MTIQKLLVDDLTAEFAHTVPLCRPGEKPDQSFENYTLVGVPSFGLQNITLSTWGL